VPEPVEEAHLLLGVPPHRVVVRQVLDELVDTRADLVREVGRRGRDECVDLFDGRHAGSLTRMRRSIPGG